MGRTEEGILHRKMYLAAAFVLCMSHANEHFQILQREVGLFLMYRKVKTEIRNIAYCLKE